MPDPSAVVTGPHTTLQATSTKKSVTTEKTTATSSMLMETTVTESYSTSKELLTTSLYQSHVLLNLLYTVKNHTILQNISGVLFRFSM